MINVNDFKPGITFEMDGGIFMVLESQHSQTGRGQAHVKSKLKNLRTGANISYTFTGGDKVKPAFIDRKKMNYLYNDGQIYYFMDNETFEQIEIDAKRMEWNKNFLKEGNNVEITTYNSEILGVVLPLRVELEVAEAEDAVKGNSTSNPQKSAVLETGYKIQVPIFIKSGEKVIVDTVDGVYISRA